jgi:DNA-binding transcriptional LysR family regulator
MVTGTVTSASNMLRISQPAVTRLLQDLERTIGYDLFIRTNRQLIPTEEGRILYEDVETAFIGLDQINNTAKNIAQFHRGHLRLVTIPSVVATFIGGILAEFNRIYPEISVSLEVQPTQRVFDYITSGQCDIGLSTLPIEHPAVVSRPILHGQSVCILPDTHRLARKRKIRPADLANEEFISYRTDSIFRHRVDDAFSAVNVPRKIRYDARTTEAIYKMVAAGLGVSVVGPSFPGMVLEPGIIARPFEPAIHGDLALLYMKQKKLARLPEAFASTTERYIATQFGANQKRSRT